MIEREGVCVHQMRKCFHEYCRFCTIIIAGNFQNLHKFCDVATIHESVFREYLCVKGQGTQFFS